METMERPWPAWDVYQPLCPTRTVLDLIAGKWTVLVVGALAGGTRRFKQLQREVGGVSQKMLTQTLRELERDGLVSRRIYAEVPPRVEYSLTELGRTLIEPLGALTAWSEGHIESILASRERASGD